MTAVLILSFFAIGPRTHLSNFPGTDERHFNISKYQLTRKVSYELGCQTFTGRYHSVKSGATNPQTGKTRLELQWPVHPPPPFPPSFLLMIGL